MLTLMITVNRQIVLVYNNFVNTMTQEPTDRSILPLPKSDDEALQHRWDYIYEPDAKAILNIYWFVIRISSISRRC